MDLFLPDNMALDPTGVLDLLMTTQHLPDGLRLRAIRLPQIDRENQEIAPRLIVHDHFDRGVAVIATAQ